MEQEVFFTCRKRHHTTEIALYDYGSVAHLNHLPQIYTKSRNITKQLAACPHIKLLRISPDILSFMLQRDETFPH